VESSPQDVLDLRRIALLGRSAQSRRVVVPKRVRVSP
jgi:hypothetical protein